MTQRGFAVAGFRDAGQWRCETLPPAVLGDLGVLLSALRSQVPEGGPFVIASVDDEFFLIARLDGPRIVLLLSDLTAAVEYPLAAQALERLGEDPPRTTSWTRSGRSAISTSSPTSVCPRTRWSASSTTSMPTRTRCSSRDRRAHRSQ